MKKTLQQLFRKLTAGIGRMKHKNIGFFTFFTLIFSLSTVSAQEVISTSGNHHESGDKSFSWTLGETVIETFKADEIILTQGFHQPALTVVSVDEIDLPGYNIFTCLT